MMRRFWCTPLLVLALTATAAPKKPAKQAEVKIQKTRLSTQDEIQLGKEAAAEVERTMEVIHNAAVESWLNEIGQRLAKTPQANAYPYYFKLLNDDSINAFALPGGPMYVHTGLIKAAENESEVAGVLAHEMSHVALRHGAAQMSKQQLYGTLFGLLGAAGGIALGGAGGQCGLWCQAVQMGAGLGGNSVLMKFSRDYERDADLNGARMMAAAGYNPISMARFFEKLQAQQGKAGEPRGLSLWLSSHPAPGSRVQYVSDDIRFYPKRDYTAGTGRFAEARQAVASLPAPRPTAAAMLQAVNGPARQGLPQGFKDLQVRGFSIAYPGDWMAGRGQDGGSIYIVPNGGAKRDSKGGIELIGGAMVDYYLPEDRNAGLDAATNQILQSLKKGDSNLRTERPAAVRVGGQQALVTRIETRTSDAADPNQTVHLYTVMTDAGVWGLVLAAPTSRVSEFEPVFRQLVQTVQFGK